MRRNSFYVLCVLIFCQLSLAADETELSIDEVLELELLLTPKDSIRFQIGHRICDADPSLLQGSYFAKILKKYNDRIKKRKSIIFNLAEPYAYWLALYLEKATLPAVYPEKTIEYIAEQFDLIPLKNYLKNHPSVYPAYEWLWPQRCPICNENVFAKLTGYRYSYFRYEAFRHAKNVHNGTNFSPLHQYPLFMSFEIPNNTGSLQQNLPISSTSTAR